MSLKVELKPGERLIVGNCVITNSDQRTRLFIDGKAPILREKDILTVETANSPGPARLFCRPADVPERRRRGRCGRTISR